MERSFYKGNREKLYDSLMDGTAALLFAGKALRKTADEDYPFYADRNFVYMTGLEKANFILMAEKLGGKTKETVFILPPDLLKERWTGKRLKPNEVTEISGIENIKYINEFDTYFHTAMRSGNFGTVAIDLYKWDTDAQDTEAFCFARKVSDQYPYLKIENLLPQIRRQRTIKQPCEIEAIRHAVTITREGILAMMKASKPGMYEYEYKAEFDKVLTSHGVLSPAFQSIISAGDNNFCIHYYEYSGRAKDGDMILNDVGAKFDNMANDVSRGWPCNGKFSDRQKALYSCAYNTSQHMFSIIKPGMPMADVDRLAREYNFTQLKALGLVEKYEDVGKLIWHGGAHHIGFDTHDTVDLTMTVAPGMVFCVDIGIYCEEWGIGFRLEDNCLVTETGCENLTASIPRTIEDIEAAMKKD